MSAFRSSKWSGILKILGKILKNLQQENLEIGQIFSSEAEQNLGKILKSSNISALTNTLADELGIWGNLRILKSES
jgi:archaellum biogenesis protein FlaJ (TadC family)